jgi:predicted outer membrane protein
MRITKFALSVLCVGTMVGTIVAQNPAPNQPRPATSSQSNSNVTLTTQHLATCLALDNQEEVILAKFAQEKIKNEEVAKFAKMLVEEHQSTLKNLSKLVPDAAREGYLTETGNGQPNSRESQDKQDKPTSSSNPGTTTDNNSARTNTTPAQSTPSGQNASVDFMQLQRETAQQCIADSKQMLSKKEGEEFDKCFVGMQIAKHAAMHTKLVVLKRHASGDLQDIVAKSIEATDKHAKAAEKLMKDLAEDK